MCTRGAQSIVPQTIHKVLCSHACKGKYSVVSLFEFIHLYTDHCLSGVTVS